LAALEPFGDPLDPLHPGVPCRADRGQLGDRTRELGLVYLVAALAPRRRCVYQADAVEHTEVLGDRLPGDGQPRAERGRRTARVGQEQIEHPSAGRVTDRGPELVIDRAAHGRATSRLAYVTRRGRNWSQPRRWSW